MHVEVRGAGSHFPPHRFCLSVELGLPGLAAVPLPTEPSCQSLISQCISYLSVAVIMTNATCRRKGLFACVFLEGQISNRHGGRNWILRAHILNCKAWSWQSKLQRRRSLELSKSTTSGTPPPAGLHHLNPPQSTQKTETFSFKPPQQITQTSNWKAQKERSTQCGHTGKRDKDLRWTLPSLNTHHIHPQVLTGGFGLSVRQKV